MIRALLAAFLVATAVACGGVGQPPPTATPTGPTSPTLAAERTTPPPAPAGSPVATYLSAPLADVRTGETFRLGDFRGRVTLVQAMAVW